MIDATEWFKAQGFTFDDKITIADVIELQEDARRFPPLPEIHDGKITREDVIATLIELRDMSYAYERSKDPAFRRCPDLEKVLEYIAINGLEPRASNKPC